MINLFEEVLKTYINDKIIKDRLYVKRLIYKALDDFGCDNSYKIMCLRILNNIYDRLDRLGVDYDQDN